MTDSMNFGPDWIRNLSSEGSTGITGGGTGGGTRYQLAEYRYGREEMLALFDKNAKPPASITNFKCLYSEQCLSPLALLPTTEEEMLASQQQAPVIRGWQNRPGASGGGLGGGVPSLAGVALGAAPWTEEEDRAGAGGTSTVGAAAARMTGVGAGRGLLAAPEVCKLTRPVISGVPGRSIVEGEAAWRTGVALARCPTITLAASQAAATMGRDGAVCPPPRLACSKSGGGRPAGETHRGPGQAAMTIVCLPRGKGAVGAAEVVKGRVEEGQH
ncbi:unnamed protein product [Acanthoscelides obtectus]|nr:unnamed protein product [Acanthoscelides obtectus]CAK1623914.1 GIGYF family protein CG11148 [Acanthoscelides obtectus]